MLPLTVLRAAICIRILTIHEILQGGCASTWPRPSAGPGAGPSNRRILAAAKSAQGIDSRNSPNQNPFSREFVHWVWGGSRLTSGKTTSITVPNYNFANRLEFAQPYSGQKAPFSLKRVRDTFSGTHNRRTSFALGLSQKDTSTTGSIVNDRDAGSNYADRGPLMNAFQNCSAPHPSGACVRLSTER